MARIHHNTAKKAKKAGIELVLVEGEVEAHHDGKLLASHLQANVALEMALAKLAEGTEKPKAKLAEGTEKPKAKLAEGTEKPKAKRRAKQVDADEQDEDGDEGNEADLDEGDEENEDKPEGKSIVKRKYKKLYRPHHMTCGDDLSQLVTAHVSTDTEDGKRVDPKALKRFAIANDCWSPEYAKLNIGQQRMNVGNRLRAKVRHGHEVAWA